MTREEIIQQYYNLGSGPGEDSYDEHNILRAMKQYAEQEVKNALEAAYAASYEDKEDILNCYKVE